MTGKPDTLIILTPGFPSNESDSTCLPLQQSLVKTIQKNNPSLKLFVISFQYPFFRGQYLWNNIPVIAAGGKNKGGIQRRMTWRRVNRELNTIQKTHTITGILSFWCGETALIGKRFADTHHLKHFCWICGQDAKANNRLVKKINPRGDELVALSDFIQREFENNHSIKPRHLIPPGVNSSKFSTSPSERVIDLLAAGSLIPLKQFDLFVDMVAAVHTQFPQIKTAICGEGPERKKLERKIAALGLKDTIQLTGELPHAELLRLMQRTRLFIHPSAYEGFGVVNLEALYAGAQVISFVQPMKNEIPGWHVASSREEMQRIIIQLLQSSKTSPVIPPDLTIEKTADAFMDLLKKGIE